FKTYFAWATEQNVIPSLSEFVRLNVDFIARSSPFSSDLLGLEGAWKKRFELASNILRTKEKSRREKTYTMYSNENEYVGNELLEDQKKPELDANDSTCAKTTRITKRLLDKTTPTTLFIASGITEENNLNGLFTTPDGNDSDKSYHPSSDEPGDDTFIEIKKKINNYTYDWFTGPGVMKSSLSEGAKKWIIDTLDVSNLLLEYRDMSVQRASENKIEEIAEIL
ncbi:16563_t:CDS:2, partial [Acaulospora colombiana]